MAGYDGISKINGVAIGNVAKASGVLKANVFSVGGEPRQSNLYKTLTTNAWASFTQGVNYASFVAVGASGTNAQAYFTDTNHSAGDTYNFTFSKTGTFGGRKVEIRVSEIATLQNTSGGGSFDVGSSSGSVSTSISTTSSNTTMYIGFLSVASSTDTLDISNFIVTKS